MGLITFGLLLSVVAAIGVGWVATQKGRSGFGFFLLSLLITPVLAILVLIALPAVTAPASPKSASGFVMCLSCRRPIAEGAPLCRFCGTHQASECEKIAMLESPRADKAGADDTRPCPVCAETIKKAAIKCRFCQSEVVPISG